MSYYHSFMLTILRKKCVPPLLLLNKIRLRNKCGNPIYDDRWERLLPSSKFGPLNSGRTSLEGLIASQARDRVIAANLIRKFELVLLCNWENHPKNSLLFAFCLKLSPSVFMLGRSQNSAVSANMLQPANSWARTI